MKCWLDYSYSSGILYCTCGHVISAGLNLSDSLSDSRICNRFFMLVWFIFLNFNRSQKLTFLKENGELFDGNYYICEPWWKNWPLALKYNCVVGGSILESVKFFGFFLDIQIVWYFACPKNFNAKWACLVPESLEREWHSVSARYVNGLTVLINQNLQTAIDQYDDTCA